MSAAELKRWMLENDVSMIDIAAFLEVHPNTVANFLKGKPVTRRTRRLFESLLREYKPRTPRAAAG